MANSGQIQFLDSIQGSSYLAIQSILEVIQRHNPDLTQSKFELVRKENSLVVILTDKGDPMIARGSLGINLESKMELSPQQLSTLKSDISQIQILDRIEGSSFLAIQVATDVFQRYNPDFMYYKIEVLRENCSFVVIFADKDRPAGTRGSIGKPGFEVELNAENLQVLRSNFIR